jgi:hypothetical protein
LHKFNLTVETLFNRISIPDPPTYKGKYRYKQIFICYENRISAAIFFSASLTLSPYSAMGSEWPPILDPNPAFPLPKWDWQLAVPVKVNPNPTIKI